MNPCMPVIFLLGCALVSGSLRAVRAAEVQAATEALSPAIPSRLAADLPRLGRAEYVGSGSCRECHRDEHVSWHRSYHRTMTQAALPGTVLGDFNGVTVMAEGLEYRLSVTPEGLQAEMPDPDLVMYAVQGGRKRPLDRIPHVTRPVVMATGSHHYQTYWVSSARHDRLLQTLPLVYLIKDRRWIPREAAFMRAPDDTERFVTQWNHHCIRCHSTGGNPGLDEATGRLNTQVGELGISCEACHGPGEEHVRDRRARAGAGIPGPAPAGTPVAADPTIVNPARLDPRRSTQVCGQCHGVYVMRNEHAMAYATNGPLFRPGEDLERTRYYIQHPSSDARPERRADLERNPSFFPERWWEDGSILAGGREYTALSASACYQRGTMSCLSCHSMHDSDPDDQLKPGMRESRACTSCHREAQYTTAVERHTFHAPASSGSDCLNCHMPHTTYALLKGIRSHQIRSPRVEASARWGVPNACNLCHLDRTLAWTGEHLSRWYGRPATGFTEEQRTTSAALLWLLKGHAAQRVITAWHVGWEPARAASGTNWLAPFQAQLLADPYGVVRYVAADALRRIPGFERFRYDFLGATNDLAHAVRRAEARWRESVKVPDRVGAEVLLSAEGAVMRERLADLLRSRDNRGVTIKE